MQSHKDLRVWQMSMDFSEEIFRLTTTFPKEEMYGITSQMRRASASIPSNIAEGYGKGGDKEIIHFLNISSGSASEIDTQLELCKRFGYIDNDTYNYMYNNVLSIRKMLNSLITSIKNKQTTKSLNNEITK